MTFFSRLPQVGDRVELWHNGIKNLFEGEGVNGSYLVTEVNEILNILKTEDGVLWSYNFLKQYPNHNGRGYSWKIVSPALKEYRADQEADQDEELL